MCRFENSFSKTASIQRKRFYFVGVISLVSLNSYSLVIRQTAAVFYFNQINKLPENVYVTIGTVRAISLSSQRLHRFNNIILYHSEIIKNAVVIRNNSLSFRPSFSDEGTLSVRAREKTMETVDWRPRKLRSQQKGKTLLGRVLVVAAVIENAKCSMVLISCVSQWTVTPGAMLMINLVKHIRAIYTRKNKTRLTYDAS